MRDESSTIDRVAHQPRPGQSRTNHSWTSEWPSLTEVFVDPVGYLRALGIESVLVVDQPGAIPNAA
jgi:hypothetical protein